MSDLDKAAEQFLTQSRQEVVALLKRHAEITCTILQENPATFWVPMLAISSWIGTSAETTLNVCAIMAPFNEDEEKQVALQALGAQTYLDGLLPMAVALSVEAWFSTQRVGTPYLQPRDDPNRQEIVSISAVCFDGSQHAMMALEVTRDAQNHIVPGELPEPLTENVRCNLLRHFFQGFKLASMAAQTDRN